MKNIHKIKLAVGLLAFLGMGQVLAQVIGPPPSVCYTSNFGGLACIPPGDDNCSWLAYNRQQSVVCSISCCYNQAGSLTAKNFAGSDGTYMTACSMGPNGDCCRNLVDESTAANQIFNNVICPSSPGYGHF